METVYHVFFLGQLLIVLRPEALLCHGNGRLGRVYFETWQMTLVIKWRPSCENINYQLGPIIPCLEGLF